MTEGRGVLAPAFNSRSHRVSLYVSQLKWAMVWVSGGLGNDPNWQARAVMAAAGVFGLALLGINFAVG